MYLLFLDLCRSIASFQESVSKESHQGVAHNKSESNFGRKHLPTPSTRAEQPPEGHPLRALRHGASVPPIDV
jgi:hypothetical protein